MDYYDCSNNDNYKCTRNNSCGYEHCPCADIYLYEFFNDNNSDAIYDQRDG
jgi:hypothetical protein